MKNKGPCSQPHCSQNLFSIHESIPYKDFLITQSFNFILFYFFKKNQIASDYAISQIKKF